MTTPLPLTPAGWPEFMSQKTAAAYLDVSTRTFRRAVRVEAVVINARAGQRGLKRYRRADLDAWMMRCQGTRRRALQGAA
jgi:hypothetical protein